MIILRAAEENLKPAEVVKRNTFYSLPRARCRSARCPQRCGVLVLRRQGPSDRVGRGRRVSRLSVTLLGWEIFKIEKADDDEIEEIERRITRG